MTDTKAKSENKPKGTDSQKPVVLVPDTNQELELLVSQKSEAELEALFLQMQKVVLERKDSKKSLAIKDIERIAAEAGLIVHIKGHNKSTKEMVPKIYQNPANASESYAAKVGARKPDWLKSLLKAGHKMQEFLVKQPQSEQPVEEPAAAQ